MRSAATAADGAALGSGARKLREAIFSHEVVAELAATADAPVDQKAALERLRQELKQAETELPVSLLGDVLTPGSGRRAASATAALSLGGGPGMRKVTMTMPSVSDVEALLAKRKKENFRMEKPEELADVMHKYLHEKFIGRGAEHVGLIAAWGPKAIGDSEGEFAEVAALMLQSLTVYRAAIQSSKDDYQFEIHRDGDGRDCLVMPPSNFALLGLKDVFHNLLQGFRVVAVVQPHFMPHYVEIQRDLQECGLPKGLFEVFPGITPDADPEVLHTVLRHVDRLQFTGSSGMFQGLVKKAFDLGNLRMEHAGEVSGLNKVRLDGVSIKNAAATAGCQWATMANNGELCTSASLIEFDPSTGDSAETVKSAVEAVDAGTFRIGTDPEDASLNVLLKGGKSKGIEVLTSSPDGLREWWEKTVLTVPLGSTGNTNTRTNESLGHCIFSPSIARSVEIGVGEDASCIYAVGVPETGPSARAGTTGCKLPNSAFGGMKSYTFAVAGDHDGVGSLGTLLNNVSRRKASWRDNDEVRAQYELTETAEGLLDFLTAQEQEAFHKDVSNVLEVFKAFAPEIAQPYGGQPLVGGEGKSQLVTLQAQRPSRKNLLIPRGVGLPDDIVKMAVLHEMSPLREVPVDLHLMDAPKAGKLRVTDPLKSFFRVVEKRLGWRLHWHDDTDALTAAVRSSEYPPYFFCVKDKHLLPVDLLHAVAEKNGYLYEGLPTDAVSLFRMLTTTQAWTVACRDEAQIKEATEVLRETWAKVGLREEPHDAPELVQPEERSPEVGGGFNAGGFGGDMGGMNLDDKDWGDLDSSSDSSDDDEPAKKAKVPEDAAKAPEDAATAPKDAAKAPEDAATAAGDAKK